MGSKLAPQRRILLIGAVAADRGEIAQALESAGYLVIVEDTAQPPPAGPADLPRVDVAIFDCSAGLNAHAPLMASLSASGVRVVALIAAGPLLASPGASAPVIYLPKPHWIAHLLPALQVILSGNEEAASLRARNEQLTRALSQGREINVVVGILMERFHLDRTTAFDILRGEARARRLRLDALAGSLLGAEERLHSLGGAGEGPQKVRV